MFVELSRLLLGLLIAFFHAPVADFLSKQDEALVVMFRRRGITVPDTMRRETAHNLFFSMGIIVAMYEIARIWLLYR